MSELSPRGGEPDNMVILTQPEADVAALLACYQKTSRRVVIASLVPDCKDRDVGKVLLLNSGVPVKKKWNNCGWPDLIDDLESVVQSEGIEQFILTGLHHYVGKANPATLYHRAELIVNIVTATRRPCVLIGQKGSSEPLLKANARLAGRFMRRLPVA